MNNIEVKVLNESHTDPAGMMMFLARLTQQGHNVNSMVELLELYNKGIDNKPLVKDISHLPHGTIKRFSPITIAITGASRRFLAQARTHHVGIDFVSASLQYSDYSNEAAFVVPFEILRTPETIQNSYIKKCENDLECYKAMIESGIDNDTAGYIMNQALRNVLIVQANHEAWSNFIRLRACHRNTPESQYVALMIWEALLETQDGEELFHWTGPDCKHGKCREGSMSCGKPMSVYENPRDIIERLWGDVLCS